MRVNLKNRGYTIVEVMVFLAVSGLMFVIAASFVSGKQANAEFRQSMDDVNTQLQQVINDVANGEYPNSSGFTCTATSGAPQLSAGTLNQGGNSGCVFLGKVIQFDVGGDATAYNVYTIAGRQNALPPNNTLTPNTFTRGNSGDRPAKPQVVIDPTDQSQQGAAFNLTQYMHLENGLTITKVSDNSTDLGPGSNDPGGAFGLFGSFANYDNSNNLVSGSQTTTVVDIKTDHDETIQDIVGYINNDNNNPHGITDNNISTNPNILLCFKGGNGQYATVTIGGGLGQRLTTTLQFYNSYAPSGC